MSASPGPPPADDALGRSLDAAFARARSEQDFLASPAFQQIDPFKLFVGESLADYRRLKALRARHQAVGLSQKETDEVRLLDERLRTLAARARRIALLQRVSRERLMQELEGQLVLERRLGRPKA